MFSRLIPLLISALTLPTFALASSESTLRVRADVWMPFNGPVDGEKPGYVVEILSAIWGGTETHVDYQLMPWKNALEAVAAGQIDAVIGANASEAKGLVVPTESAGSPRIGLYTLKNKQWNYQSLASLRAIKLGAIEGYSYYEALDGYIAAAKGAIVMLKGEDPLHDGIQKLNAGEIDVLPEAQPVLIWTLKKAGLPLADYRAVYLHEAEPIYVAFTNNAAGKAHASEFDAGIQRLRSSGGLAEILKKYGLSDWK